MACEEEANVVLCFLSPSEMHNGALLAKIPLNKRHELLTEIILHAPQIKVDIGVVMKIFSLRMSGP